MNRVAVVGSRGFDDYKIMVEALDDLKIDLIVSGGARGADRLAERYAEEMGINTLIFPANWIKYGMSAGFIRNDDIVKNCDLLIAFWDGNSKGTMSSIRMARKQGKEVIIIHY